MEQDKELSGNGNSYTTMFRQYDPRLGRWKSLDPLAGEYPSQSPFAAFNDNPIYFVDPLGLERTPGNGGDEIETKEENGKIYYNVGGHWTLGGPETKVEGEKPKNAGLNSQDYHGGNLTPPLFYSNGYNTIGVYDQPGVKGDWLATYREGYPRTSWPSWARSTEEMTRIQSYNFAEDPDVDGTWSYDLDHNVYKVRLNDDSPLLHEILFQLKEEGIILEDLTEYQLEQIRTFVFSGTEDNSHYFAKLRIYYPVYESQAVPITSPNVIPIVLPLPGDNSQGANTISTTTIVATQAIVDERVATVLSFAKTKNNVCSADSDYNESSEHTKGKRKSTKKKHQKGRRRAKRDQGGEKGDINRKRYK